MALARKKLLKTAISDRQVCNILLAGTAQVVRTIETPCLPEDSELFRMISF